TEPVHTGLICILSGCFILLVVRLFSVSAFEQFPLVVVAVTCGVAIRQVPRAVLRRVENLPWCPVSCPILALG
uniref:Uncharacterized protein n=1 Tax=Triticum urartu TaxID=4572 RepID=A0A8R7U2U2_TRIUA